MSEELKPLPCPFCGGPGVLITNGKMAGWVEAECKPGCAAEPCTYIFDDCWEALKAWNTRASDSRRCENCEHWLHLFADSATGNCEEWNDIPTKPGHFCADFTKRGE